MPRDADTGYSQFWSDTPPKNWLLRALQNGILHGCAPALEKTIRPTFVIFYFFGCFCWKFCHADRRSWLSPSRELRSANNKRPCSEKWKKSGQIAFFLFFRRKCCHDDDFVTLFLTFANNKRAPTRLIRPRPIDCDRGSEKTVKILPVFARFFSSIVKKKSVSFGFCILYISSMYVHRYIATYRIQIQDTFTYNVLMTFSLLLLSKLPCLCLSPIKVIW